MVGLRKRRGQAGVASPSCEGRYFGRRSPLVLPDSQVISTDPVEGLLFGGVTIWWVKFFVRRSPRLNIFMRRSANKESVSSRNPRLQPLHEETAQHKSELNRFMGKIPKTPEG